MTKLILMLVFANALANQEDKTLGMSEINAAISCDEIYQRNPLSRGSISQYWIANDEGLFEVTCNMKLKCGGVEGGWMQIVDVNMNRDETCPGTWQKTTTPRALCLGSVGAGCASAHFSAKGVTYEHICGQAKGYQKGHTNAYQKRLQAIDDAYVDGISITLGSPRSHVWTYAVGLSDDYNHGGTSNCPCATYPGLSPPAFVGNDYYCESGDVGTYHYAPYYLSDPLWDGSGCTSSNGCCAQIGMPWFYRKLPMTISKDFEVRICKSASHANEDVAIENLDLYIK